MPGWERGDGSEEETAQRRRRRTSGGPQATIGIEPTKREVGWQEEEEVGKRNRDWEGDAKATLTENSSGNEKL
eukprot:3937491-Rhodomonas_salina.2